MYSMTQKDIILLYLKELNGWEFEYKIRAMQTPQGYWIGARGDRNVRELIEEKKLDSEKRGIYRVVRYKETQSTVHINTSPKQDSDYKLEETKQQIMI